MHNVDSGKSGVGVWKQSQTFGGDSPNLLLSPRSLQLCPPPPRVSQPSLKEMIAPLFFNSTETFCRLLWE